ncbi:MAG: GH3 auxin-responsive promoter family protein [Muribaculaceae bacterium]|nr:GH3 auxin-responsive promoter family protein [Muribaculaceae bacterium]
MNFTPLARIIFRKAGLRTDAWASESEEIQLRQLRWLIFKGADTEFGRKHNFESILANPDPRRAFRENVAIGEYEYFRPYVMKMTDGQRDILWPGYCYNFAQSSGTSGGRSKFIPITRDSLRVNHFPGARDVMAQYLRAFPESRIFSGKGMILGGSFETRLHPKGHNVKAGDLSATLIDTINPLVNLFRIPSKRIALNPDWTTKLDQLAKSAIGANLTNISGVPSWFLRVILRALEISGKEKASDLWPNLEVFFHGGISFDPYREEYTRITDAEKMHFFETYNASEGFFATQSSPENDGLLLLIDNGIYYEFLPIGCHDGNDAVGIEGVEKGRIYELIITACNGLWRYSLGDTVEIVDTNPVKIRIAGRTHSFINAFGEELMENNAERAIADACAATGANIRNYTAGPLYAHGREKGRHQWLIEWDAAPSDINLFRDTLDASLKELNSDYAAKRSGDIFLDPPQIITLPEGAFDKWLSQQGSGKLGGQRKIPRLRNDRSIIDGLLG